LSPQLVGDEWIQGEKRGSSGEKRWVLRDSYP
jgi:hypothetical protein